MTKSSWTKVGPVKKDIISELPRNILETILCFLPIMDAVRTSILSKKWRHCWTMIPHLIFDDGFADRVLGEEDVPYDENKDKVMAYAFVSVINKILLLHRGPIIKFSLDIPRDKCNCLIIHDYIDQWIPLFSSKGLKQLVLNDSEHEFSAHQFSFVPLNHLRLFIFTFHYSPAFARFAHLKNLELVAVDCEFKEAIFDCPVLEKLTLIICNGLNHTNFRAPNLKCLLQVDRCISPECVVGLENLTEFSFVLGCECKLEMPKETSILVKVFSSLHTIEKFSIGQYFIEYLAAGGSPNRLPKLLPYLKTLNICDIDFTDMSVVSCLLCLIRSAPNLCNLNISGNRYLDLKGDLKDFWEEDYEDCTINHLQIITFSYFKGLRAELNLVKFLLARSPLLKTMSIHRHSTMENGVALTMAEEMLQYSRASSRAEIRRLKSPIVIDDFIRDLWPDDIDFLKLKN